eukprot:c1415_g1_i1 orf=373-639(-)
MSGIENALASPTNEIKLEALVEKYEPEEEHCFLVFKRIANRRVLLASMHLACDVISWFKEWAEKNHHGLQFYVFCINGTRRGIYCYKT